MKFLDLLNKPVTFRRRIAGGDTQDAATDQPDEQATTAGSARDASANNQQGREHASHGTRGSAVAPAHNDPAHEQAYEQAHALLSQHIDEAALLFAAEQADAAARLLSAALAAPPPNTSEIERHAWWMLLELHKARGQQADFDLAALAYAQRFEASPPQWVAPHGEPQLTVRASAAAAPLLLDLRGALTGDAQPMLLQWRQRSATATDISIDLAHVSAVDLAGCHLLLDLLADWQQRGACVQLRACDSVLAMLHELIQSGRRDADDAGWRLLIELLRLAGDVERYEDACLAYSLTFEMSPPAAPPPVINDRSKSASGTGASGHSSAHHRTSTATSTGASAGAGAAAHSSVRADTGASAALPTSTAAFVLPEVIIMPIDPVLVALRAHVRQAGAGLQALVLDARQLQRIDFHAVSVLQSALAELAAGKPVEWQGVSFLVSTLLQLTCGSAMPGIINRMP